MESSIKESPQPPSFYVSPCGNHLESNDVGPLPDGWINVDGKSDSAIASLMERRWWASSKS
jgi:hypothetical protein